MPGIELEHCRPDIAGVFEAVVARSPERVAVATPERTITYAELSAWADRIAR